MACVVCGCVGVWVCGCVGVCVCMYVCMCVCVCVCVCTLSLTQTHIHTYVYTYIHTHQFKPLEQQTVNEIPVETPVSGGMEAGLHGFMSGAGSESVRGGQGREERQSVSRAREPGDAQVDEKGRVERLAVAEGEREAGRVGGWEAGRDARTDSDAAAGGEEEEEEERRRKERKLVAALAALKEEVEALRKEQGTHSQKSAA